MIGIQEDINMNKRFDNIKEQLPTQVKEAGEGALRALRSQARRPDRVGEVTHRTWELVNGGVGVAARSLSRLERATQPPARTMNAPAKPAGRPTSRRTASRKPPTEKPGNSSNS
jgi:hypothetical protein